MKRCYFLFAVALLGFTAFACSKTPSTETAKANTNSNPTLVEPPLANQNSQEAIPGIAGAPAGKLDTAEKSGGPNPAPAGAAVPSSVMPAPDDSTFTSKLTDIAVETRTFRKHPQLLKVEKTIEPGKQTIKVTLRNGKVVDLPGDRINNLSTIPASEILGLIGMTPPQPKAANPGEVSKKAQ